MLRDTNGRWLLVQSAKNKADWSFPQGGVEADEDLTKTLFREVEEETGITSDLLGPPEFKGFENLDAEAGRLDKRGFTKGKRYFFFHIPFKRDGTAHQLRLQPEELTGARWLLPEELQEGLATTRSEKRSMMLRFIAAN